MGDQPQPTQHTEAFTTLLGVNDGVADQSKVKELCASHTHVSELWTLLGEPYAGMEDLGNALTAKNGLPFARAVLPALMYQSLIAPTPDCLVLVVQLHNALVAEYKTMDIRFPFMSTASLYYKPQVAKTKTLKKENLTALEQSVEHPSDS